MILWKATVRHYVRHPWQVILSTVGITLGVAVVVAIDLINNSANTAFEISADALTGRATHQIIGVSDGVPEDLYPELREREGISHLAPVVEGYAKLIGKPGSANNNSNGVFKLVGVDLFAETPFRGHLNHTIGDIDYTRFLGEPNTVILAKSAAARLGVKLNEQLTFLIAGAEQRFTVVGFIDDHQDIDRLALSSMLFVDIATAQEVLGMQGYLSRIDVILPDTREGKTALQDLKVSLPTNIDIISANARNNALAQMTKAFETNLTALSLLALIVGMFLIYNTMTFSVVLRRQIIGALRTVGVTRREVFKMIFAESLFIGVVSTWLGIFIGIVLAEGLLGLVTRTINDLYFVLNVNKLDISYLVILKGITIGVVATAVTGLIPAYEATKSTPRASLTRSTLEAKYREAFKWTKWIGGGLIALGALVLLIPNDFLWLSFAGLFSIIAGFALYVPQLTLTLVNLSVPLHHKVFGALGNISARSVSSSLSRTSIAVASLSVAIATTIGVAVMIDSFRGSVIAWLDNSLQANIFVTTPGVNASTGKGNLSPAWVDRFRQMPEIRAISIRRDVQLHAPKGITDLHVLKIPVSLFSSFELKEGDYATAEQGFFQEDALLVSEPYAYHHDIDVGEMMVLPTDKGLKSFRVAGIYVDYSSDRGVVTIYRDTYQRYWDDDSITSLGLHTDPSVNVDYFIDKLRAVVADYQVKAQADEPEQELIIKSNLAIKQASIRVFDRTFVVTEVLRLLAIFVAFVGIVSALMSIQFERRAEVALFRVLGLTPQEVWLMVSGETGLIGAIAGILAIPLGLILAAVLIFVINRRSFGWSMDITLDPMLFVQSLLLAITAAMIAGMIPAFKMSKSNPVNALREE
ncbi:MAG: FtsX-like permease family protein [Gammaproteobacteria bacterium]